MTNHQRAAQFPREVISLTTYAQLDLYLGKFSTDNFGLILLLGRHGTGKSESVKRVLSMRERTKQSAKSQDHELPRPLYVEGHMQPFGLYCQLWSHRNQPVVLDDLDGLYADPECVRLLKPLCDTIHERRLYWLTNITLNDGQVPSSFATTSRVILIANEWKSINPNVRALEDRAIILHFNPSNEEVHGRVGEWLDDPEIYGFVKQSMPSIPANSISMRHYCKGSQLRRAGLLDWRASLLQMILPDFQTAAIIAIRLDPQLRTEEERVQRFMSMTQCSRSTYFRMKAKLATKEPADS